MPIVERLPNESKADYERRYCREKMRIYRARKKDPNAPKKLRGKNKAPGKHGTLSTEEWEDLKPRPGETPEEHKRRYAREIMKRWRAKNKEKEAARRRELYAANRDNEVMRQREYRLANPDKAQASARKYFEKNKEKRLAALKEWGAKNPDRLKEACRRWFKAHPEASAASAARWRARLVQACPPWVWKLHGKEIESIYRAAAKISRATGIPHHVDHYEALAAVDRCGLHVPWNLRVITAEENMKKGNRPVPVDESQAA